MRVQAEVFWFVFLAALVAFPYNLDILDSSSRPTELGVDPPDDVRRNPNASSTGVVVTSQGDPDPPRPAIDATSNGWTVPQHILSLNDLAGFDDTFDAAAAASLRWRNRRRAEALREAADAWGESLVCNATAVPFPPHQGRKVRFLHVPKTGSTFFNAVVRYGCHAQRDEVPYIGDRKPNCTSNKLRKIPRYGKLCEYNSEELLPVLLKKCSPLWFHQPPFYGENITANYLSTNLQHAPLRYEKEAQTAVGLFRLPDQRLVSAFGWNYHAWSMRAGLRRYLTKIVLKENNTPSAFARFPGVRGCQTKTLTGFYCGDMIETKLEGIQHDVHPLGPLCYLQPKEGGEAGEKDERVCAGPDESYVKAAIRRIRALAFAGVMEQWQLSVCLFHRLLGGEVGKMELCKTHVQTRNSDKAATKPVMFKYNAGGRSDLDGFVDITDKLVYAAVLDLFEAKLDCVLLKLKRGEKDTEMCANVATASGGFDTQSY